LTKLYSCGNNKGNKIKEGAMATAYCMKCRKKVEMRNPRQITLKNGRPAVQGVCPSCGTKVFRIGKA
jgi:NAD-dependent SIR2 family protein deacetylase